MSDARTPHGLHLQTGPELGLARRGQIVVGALTLTAHLLAIALMLHQAKVTRVAAQPPVAVFVSLVKDRPPPPPKPALKRMLVPVPAVELPLPQFSTAPDFGAGPPPLAIGDPIYLAQVQSHLANFSASRDNAATGHIEVTVRLQLILDLNGNVVFSHIEKRSGSAVLDAQILALVQNAQPLPPIPQYLHADRVYLVVPVTFSLPR